MTKPSLADLTAFQSIAEHRSFRRAADVLGVSRSSLSHIMRTLEQRLGVRLLHRTTRSVAPTEAGERLLRRLAPALRDLDAALDSVSGDSGQPSGVLRINGNEAAVRLLLKEVVPRFLAEHAQMSLDLVTDGRLIDIVEQGFDAGLRLAEAVPQDMIAVRLGGDARFIAIASPSYLAGKSVPVHPDDLHDHRCIRQRLPSGKLYRWEFSSHGQEIAIDVPGVLTLDHSEIMVEAAVAGLGIAYVPETSARPWLDSGALVTLLGDWSPAFPGLCLYYPGHRLVPAGLRAFIDIVKQVRDS